MPIPVQSPGPGAQLERRFAFKGGVRLFIDETIVPVEVILPRARKYAMGTASVAAGGAGLRSEVAISNGAAFGGPEITETAVLIHEVTCWGTGVITNYELVHTTSGIAGFTNLATKSFLNFPLGVGPSALILEDNTAAATAGTVFSRRRTLSSTLVHWDFRDYPLVLDTRAGAGATLVIRPDVDNLLFECDVVWSEPPDPA